MSLSSSLQVGRSALLASQTAIEIAGQNLANAATRGYHRRDVVLSPVGDTPVESGVYVGQGVEISAIRRVADEALEGRVRASISNAAGSVVRQDVLTQIEAIENELSGNDLSTQLDAFFNSFDDLALRPRDHSLRELAIQQGRSLALFTQSLRSDLADMRVQIDAQIDGAVTRVNDLLDRIAQLNGQIAGSDSDNGGDFTLRDQRDALLLDLSELLDISTVQQDGGILDVFVGSTPIVLNGESRGVALRQDTDADGNSQITLTVAEDGTPLDAKSGRLGALINARGDTINETIGALDSFANQLIYEVNKLHSQGQPIFKATSYTSNYRVTDTGAALNSAAAGLKFDVTHGSFDLHVTQKATGERVTSTIQIDLDGLNPPDTTLTSLAAQIDAIDNVSASVTSDGRLVIAGDTEDFELSFSDDSSGVLAALGINTFFTGSNAVDIDVDPTVMTNPDRVATALGHAEGDNRTALAISGLRDQPLDALDGISLSELWRRHVEDGAVRLSQARQQSEADGIVQASLEAQQQVASGVNVDEETINILQLQRSFQASARFLGVVDEMMQTLVGLL